tara:strand:- start:117178 stop:118248 length:1071 start_codon:yes stop_codon:yes gene_type:complete
MPNIFGKNYNRRELLDLIGDVSQVANARYAELKEGSDRGADLIEVFNASGLCFSVLPGRALDIASAHYKGMSLCFRGNTGDVGPSFYEPQGNGWLRGFFGGLVLSCGLTFTGHPEIDQEEENEELGLHGRLSFLPARQVHTEGVWSGDDYVIKIIGKIREAVVFGTNLEMTREISTVLGEKSIRIHDQIHNLAVDRSPLMFVYHCNPGFPILDEGTRMVINSEKTTEWLNDQEVTVDDYGSTPAPNKEAQNNVFIHYPRSDINGQCKIALINDRLQLGLYWSFPQKEMPLVTHWQHFHRGTYVTGIEPGNVSMLGRAWNKKNGYMQYIEPDETRDFHLEIGVLEGKNEISDFESTL